jgi:hypothetical protein
MTFTSSVTGFNLSNIANICIFTNPDDLYHVKTTLKLYYNRLSADQSILLSANHLWPATNYSSFLICRQLWVYCYGATSPTRGRTCSLQLPLGPVRSLPRIRIPQGCPNLEGQIPAFISPRSKIAHLYRCHWIFRKHCAMS